MFATFSKPVLAAVAMATAAASLPAAANAQSYVPGYGGATYGQQQYDYGAQRYYDPCDRERQGRTGAGAVIGAGAGAVVGSQLAARGRRTEGSILGGVLGAVIGGSVGRGSSDRCYENQGYGQPAYSQQPVYEGYDQRGYDDRGYSQSAQVYYDENGYGPYSTNPSYSGQSYSYSSQSYSSPSSSYGSYNQGYTDGRQDARRDRRDGYDRRDETRGQVQYSADGRYWYDPQYGWRPR